MTDLRKAEKIVSDAAGSIAEKAHRAVDRMSDGVDEIQHRARVGTRHARRNLRAVGEGAKEASTAAAAGLKSRMEAHPIATLGAVFAAGLLVSSLWRR